MVFWGLGVGIVDMEYRREAVYSESMAGALVYNSSTNSLVNGNAGFSLSNLKYTRGSALSCAR